MSLKFLSLPTSKDQGSNPSTVESVFFSTERFSNSLIFQFINIYKIRFVTILKNLKSFCGKRDALDCRTQPLKLNLLITLSIHKLHFFQIRNIVKISICKFILRSNFNYLSEIYYLLLLLLLFSWLITHCFKII